MSDLKDKVWAISRMGSGSHLMAVVLAEVRGCESVRARARARVLRDLATM